jgi:hypothetical protein
MVSEPEPVGISIAAVRRTGVEPACQLSPDGLDSHPSAIRFKDHHEMSIASPCLESCDQPAPPRSDEER